MATKTAEVFSSLPTMSDPLQGLSEQFQWHRKPAGWNGAPCPVCGAEQKRLKALHRALPFPESHKYRGSHVKMVKTDFGTDFDILVIR